MEADSEASSGRVETPIQRRESILPDRFTYVGVRPGLSVRGVFSKAKAATTRRRHSREHSKELQNQTFRQCRDQPSTSACFRKFFGTEFFWTLRNLLGILGIEFIEANPTSASDCLFVRKFVASAILC